MIVDIDTIRKKRNVTIEQLADMMGVTRAYLTNVKNGRQGKRWNEDLLKNAAKALRCEVSDLVIQKHKDKFPPSGRVIDAEYSTSPDIFISDVEHEMYGYVIKYAAINHPELTAKDIDWIARMLLRYADGLEMQKTNYTFVQNYFPGALEELEKRGRA